MRRTAVRGGAVSIPAGAASRDVALMLHAGTTDRQGGSDVLLEATVSRTLTTVCIGAMALLAFAYPALGHALR
jgi:hypothetical protein